MWLLPKVSREEDRRERWDVNDSRDIIRESIEWFAQHRTCLYKWIQWFNKVGRGSVSILRVLMYIRTTYCFYVDYIMEHKDEWRDKDKVDLI